MRTTLGNVRGQSLDRDGDIAKALLFTMKHGDEAAHVADLAGMNAEVIQFCKTASPAAMSTALSSRHSAHLSRFIVQNAPRSAFNVMKPSMTEVPLHARVAVQSAVIGAASSVGEGQPKPVKRLNVTSLDTEIDKYLAIVAITTEFADMAPELATRVVADSLSESVARGVDGFFVGKLNAASSEEFDSNVNPTFAEMLDELGELLRRVQTGEASRLYFIMQVRNAKYLSTMAYGAGVTTAKYSGGEILGVPIVVSDAQTSGTVTVADASALVYGATEIAVASSDVATIELSDAPTNASGPSVTATSMVSCLQAGFIAIKAEQSVAFRVADTGAVASLTGTQWGVGEGSPVGV